MSRPNRPGFISSQPPHSGRLSIDPPETLQRADSYQAEHRGASRKTGTADHPAFAAGRQGEGDSQFLSRPSLDVATCTSWSLTAVRLASTGTPLAAAACANATPNDVACAV